MKKITQDELSEIIVENKENMYRLAFSIVKNDVDAQDAVSEAIVLAFERRHQLRKPSSARAWLMQILVNASKQIIARSNRVILTEQEQQLETASMIESNEMWEIVMELEEEFREIVVLYYYEEFAVKEISKMLKIPEGTVKSRLARARQKLLKIME